MKHCAIVTILGCALFLGPVMDSHAAAAAPAAPAGGVPRAQPANGGRVSIDFNNVDLKVLIKFMSELTGKNFILDQKVEGTVTAYSPTPISVDEAYQVFLSILEVNKFRVVQAGSVYKILPDADAQVASTDEANSQTTILPAEVVTRVIPLRQSDAAELAKFLPQLLGEQGKVSAYAPSNTLIVTTSSGLMQKVLSVVNEVDQGKNQPAFQSFAMRNANAKAAAEKVNRLLSARNKNAEGLAQGRFAVVEGDERTGHVVALADPASMSFISSTLQSFDLPTSPGKGDMRILPLKFASAEDLAKVLTELTSAQSPRTGSTSSSTSNTTEGQTERTLISTVTVVADKATNSLLIAASPRDYETIADMVAKLDVERRQVYVEAMILEVSAETARSLGVNWHAGAALGSNDYLIFGGSRPGLSGGFGTQGMGDTTLITPPSGGSLGVIAAPITFGGISFATLDVMANFMRTDNRFKILATPQLMTLDNEEATVVVAENIPFLTQTAVGQNANDRVIQSVDYRDVGITLKILPQVSSNGKIKLKVQQIVSRVVSQGITSQGQTLAMPTTRRREVNTRVMLDDGQTLVIAGLIAQDQYDNLNAVPGLGDVPALGWLFKAKDDKMVDTNLLLFLTPKVILNRQDAQMLEVTKRQALHRIETGATGISGPARMPMRLMPPRLAPRVTAVKG